MNFEKLIHEGLKRYKSKRGFAEAMNWSASGLDSSLNKQSLKVTDLEILCQKMGMPITDFIGNGEHSQTVAALVDKLNDREKRIYEFEQRVSELKELSVEYKRQLDICRQELNQNKE